MIRSVFGDDGGRIGGPLPVRGAANMPSGLGETIWGTARAAFDSWWDTSPSLREETSRQLNTLYDLRDARRSQGQDFDVLPSGELAPAPARGPDLALRSEASGLPGATTDITRLHADVTDEILRLRQEGVVGPNELKTADELQVDEGRRVERDGARAELLTHNASGGVYAASLVTGLGMGILDPHFGIGLALLNPVVGAEAAAMGAARYLGANALGKEVARAGGEGLAFALTETGLLVRENAMRRAQKRPELSAEQMAAEVQSSFLSGALLKGGTTVVGKLWRHFSGKADTRWASLSSQERASAKLAERMVFENERTIFQWRGIPGMDPRRPEVAQAHARSTQRVLHGELSDIENTLDAYERDLVAAEQALGRFAPDAPTGAARWGSPAGIAAARAELDRVRNLAAQRSGDLFFASIERTEAGTTRARMGFDAERALGETPAEYDARWERWRSQYDEPKGFKTEEAAHEFALDHEQPKDSYDVVPAFGGGYAVRVNEITERAPVVMPEVKAGKPAPLPPRDDHKFFTDVREWKKTFRKRASPEAKAFREAFDRATEAHYELTRAGGEGGRSEAFTAATDDLEAAFHKIVGDDHPILASQRAEAMEKAAAIASRRPADGPAAAEAVKTSEKVRYAGRDELEALKHDIEDTHLDDAFEITQVDESGVPRTRTVTARELIEEADDEMKMLEGIKRECAI